MQFELFRISLAMRIQIDLAEYRNPGGKIPTREEWLRIVFSEQIRFSSRGRLFYFAPIIDSHDGLIITGKIGRRIIEKENASPDESFVDIDREQWHAVNVIVDPTHHADGQQLAIEVKSVVGSSHAILEGLASHINNNDRRAPYTLDIGAISDPRTFWDFVKENEGNITTLTLEAPVPNMFGHENDYDEEMRKYREIENAQRVAVKITNSEGLKTNTKTIKNGVEYTAKMGGKINARAKKRRSYNSQKKVRKVDIDSIEESNQERGIFRYIKMALEGLILK